MASIINTQELERQIAACESEVADLSRQLATVSSRLHALQSIRDSAMQLDATIEDDNLKDGSSAGVPRWRINEPRLVMNPSGSVAFEVAAPKKIRSTQMVADLVNGEMREWTRDDIHRGFASTYGIPANWGTPANAINNAIARAVEKDLIAERGGLYMPWPVYRGQALDGDDDA
jgi:hypothetical protein